MYNNTNKTLIIWSLAVTLTFLGVFEARPQVPVRVQNDVVVVQVHTESSKSGRFNIGTAASTTLLYSFPAEPLTSHTNIKLDGVVYSNDSESTGARPLLFSTPEPTNGTITCRWRMSNVNVEQRLTAQQYGESTGAIFIQYVLTNHDHESHRVGVLLEMDTMINENDEAPLATSFGYSAIPKRFVAPNIPDFFQAFEISPVNPGLIAQGTLKGRNAVPPDLFIVGGWQQLRNVLWDFHPGNERYGDSAVILRWDERTLAPGETRTVATYYGVGEVTKVMGQLALNVGATDTLELAADRSAPDPFDVNLIVTNTGDGVATDVQAEIQLPKGLTLLGSDARAKLSNPSYLDAGESGHTSWRVQPDFPVQDSTTLTYRIVASASSADSNFLVKRVSLVYKKDVVPSTDDNILSGERKKKIRELAKRSVDMDRIDFKDFIEVDTVKFFPLGYYKPFLATNLEDFKIWAERNPFAPEFVNRELGDKYSPAFLNYTFEEIVKEINKRLIELTEDEQKSSSILIFSFEGFADHREVASITHVGPPIECQGNRIEDEITDNRELACLRAYYTKEELIKYLKKRSRQYFPKLLGEDRIKFAHSHFEPDGVSPESRVIAKSGLSQEDKEKEYKKIRRSIITLGYAPFTVKK